MVRYRLGPQSSRAYQQLRADLLSGKWEPGTRLPAHRVLAAQLRVAPLTLRQALAQLEEDGLLTREQGRGTFVRGPAKSEASSPQPPVVDARFQRMIEHMDIGVLLYGLGGEILVYNRASCDLLGLTGDQLLGRAISDPAWRVIQADGEPFPVHEFPVAQALTTRASVQGVTMGVYRPTSQDWVWLQVNAEPYYAADGRLEGVINTFTDITARRREEEALRESEARYRQMFETNSAIKLLIDPQSGAIIDANSAACSFYGYSLEELRTKPITDINVLPVEEVSRGLAEAATQERTSFTFRHRVACGEIRDVEIHSSPIDVQGRRLLFSIVHDITDRRRIERELEHQALHDTLTDLPNRVLLGDRLEQAIRVASRATTSVALLLMDLDRFKEVNDTFGHYFGDLLLAELGQRIRSVLRESDTVARLGGDEFAVLLPTADTQGAVTIAETIRTALERPFLLQDQLFNVEGSIGIAVFPDHGEDADTLLRHADVAMYLAKQHGTGYALYLPDQDQYSPARLALIGELRRAIESDQLFLQYQPKIDLQTGQVVGVEALVRWQHPERGLLPPDEFIPLAEHTGLIKPLGIWVLEQAVRQCRAWHDQGIEIQVAVNLSARNLTDAYLSSTVSRLLERYQLRPDWLQLELTESAVMTDLFRSMQSLSHLHEMGVNISVDDFGTGHSSLSYLRRLPISEIKIDRSFVKDMQAEDSDFLIVRATIDLGHDLGLQAVAEGIESQDACALLTRLGCDLGQGYFLSRPLAASDCTEWLRGQQIRRAPGGSSRRSER